MVADVPRASVATWNRSSSTASRSGDETCFHLPITTFPTHPSPSSSIYTRHALLSGKQASSTTFVRPLLSNLINRAPFPPRSGPESIPGSYVSCRAPSSVTTMPGLVTATGVLGFLADEEPELKVFALQTLNDDIDTVWTEVAGALGQM